MVYGWGITRSLGSELPIAVAKSSSNSKLIDNSASTPQSNEGADLAVSHAKHTALISVVLTKTIKIQKEVSRSRKSKEILPKLNEAIRLLTKFKDEIYPSFGVHGNIPPHQFSHNDKEQNVEELPSDISESKTTSTASTEIISSADLPGKVPGAETDEPDTGEVESINDASMAEGSTLENDKEDEDLSSGNVDDDSKHDETAVPSIDEKDTNMLQSNLEVDIHDHDEMSIESSNAEKYVKNFVSMNAAIVSTLQAYCLILNFPSKTSKTSELVLECINDLMKNNYIAGEAMGHDKLTVKQGTNNEGEDTKQLDSSHINSFKSSLLNDLIESITRCSDSTTENIQILMNKTLLTSMTSSSCGIHEAAMLMSVRATFHVYLVTKFANSRTVAKTTLIDMLKSVFNRLEAYDASIKTEAVSNNKDIPVTNDEVMPKSINSDDSGENNGKVTSSMQPQTPQPVQGAPFVSQLHTDAYLLFRALCKLSAKNLPGDRNANDYSALSNMSSKLNPFSSGSTVDPLALNSKLLSLELILSIFEHCGPAFGKGERFIYAAQNYLCVSLLKNCMSVHTNVSHLSLKIFVVLVYKFKSHLKAEIEVFVANIFLKILESPNSPTEQKILVLDAFRIMCSDPSILTQLFLNFDCDIDAVDLYKNIIQILTRLSNKTRSAQYANTKSPSEDFILSVAALEVLVIITRTFIRALDLPGSDDVIEDTSYKLSQLGGNQINIDLSAMKGDKLNNLVGSDNVNSVDNSKHGKDSTGGNLNASSHIPADFAGKIVAAFDTKRTKDENFETGLVKFKLSMKEGLRFFIENGFVETDARDMSRFLLEHREKLDMTQIGEVLGKEPDSCFDKKLKEADAEKGGTGFFVRVLSHYTAAFDFTGMKFDEAIRLFLSGFRLPGEAQKIDRIMEKFAERYTHQNEDVFASADTAFILAFSVIMLQTDLHNPSIKPEKRMTSEGFIRNNRGISVDGGDLPSDFLEGIYKRIQANPFTLKEDDDARAAQNGLTKELIDTSFFADTQYFFGSSVEERRKEKFRKEREAMMKASEQLFRRRPKSSGTNSNHLNSQLTESILPADVVKPMFDVTWGPLIGTLSQVLEMANDERSISLCLNGFIYSIRISSHSGMSLSRDTFVSSLAKFTTLGYVQQMKKKNIESIKTLLSIAIVDGEFLGESWGPVLQCISQLGRLQLLSSGLASDDAFLRNGESSEYATSTKDAEVVMDRETEQYNGRAVLAAMNEALIDKVFASTVKLSARGIVQFVGSLVAVSEDEIAGNTKKGISGVSRSSRMVSETVVTPKAGSGHGEEGPRIFSLQRLVEVADFNMDVRPRISWTKMWEIMAKHFAKIGCHENGMVSMFAIDALRQLSFKFLEKPELTDFNFQRIFLRPFLLIMKDPRSREDRRELILRCVDNMIRSMSRNLRSGWKIIFSILTLSASDPVEKISTLGLAILQHLLDQHLDQLFGQTCPDNEENLNSDIDQRKVSNARAEDFVGLCRASLSYVQIEESENPLPIGLSMRALCHIACYADLIVDKKVIPPVSGAQSKDPETFGYTYGNLSENEALEMVLWRPLFDGLAAGISSPAKSQSGGVGCFVQRGSVMTMRSILLRHGKRFSTAQWNVILSQVLCPSIQKAAESDKSPIVQILSDSPIVSSLDFLSSPLPLPPSADDEGLRKIEFLTQSEERGPTRSLGTSELLVEASFADLRHCGSGDLSKAYELAKKDVDTQNDSEQPFPDSWIATTAPIALGILSDLFGQILIHYPDAHKTVWPIIFGQFQRWCNGHPAKTTFNKPLSISPLGRYTYSMDFDNSWLPSEALVRIGCNELFRAVKIILNFMNCSELATKEKWSTVICSNIAATLKENLFLEKKLFEELVKDKLCSLGISSSERETEITTAFGQGTIVNEKIVEYLHGEDGRRIVRVAAVELDFGGKLYSPTIIFDTETDCVQKSEDKNPDISESRSYDHPYLKKYLPPLKVTCIASYCVQYNLYGIVNQIVAYCKKNEVESLLEILEESRLLSQKASLDEDLAHAFQEAVFKEWDDGVEEVESALVSLGRMNHRESGKSGLFFLTQEAVSNNSLVHLLGSLYCDGSSSKTWDCESFSETKLLERMMDVLHKFLASEQKESHRMDPNVWRHCHENSGIIAVYCTSFANVIVGILKKILLLRSDQFEKHQMKFFPVLCDLIRVQSDEIRKYVREIFIKQFGGSMSLNYYH